jgi:hypothetical protein
LYPKRLLPIKTSVVNYSKFAKRDDIKNIAHTIFNLEIPVPFNNENTELIFVYGSKEDALRSMKWFNGIDEFRLIVKNDMRHCQFVTNFRKNLLN